jgi:hypothetical protein
MPSLQLCPAAYSFPPHFAVTVPLRQNCVEGSYSCPLHKLAGVLELLGAGALLLEL